MSYSLYKNSRVYKAIVVVKYRTRYVYNQNILNMKKQNNDSINIGNRYKIKWFYNSCFKKGVDGNRVKLFNA